MWRTVTVKVPKIEQFSAPEPIKLSILDQNYESTYFGCLITVVCDDLDSFDDVKLHNNEMRESFTEVLMLFPELAGRLTDNRDEIRLSNQGVRWTECLLSDSDQELIDLLIDQPDLSICKELVTIRLTRSADFRKLYLNINFHPSVCDFEGLLNVLRFWSNCFNRDSQLPVKQLIMFQDRQQIIEKFVGEIDQNSIFRKEKSELCSNEQREKLSTSKFSISLSNLENLAVNEFNKSKTVSNFHADMILNSFLWYVLTRIAVLNRLNNPKDNDTFAPESCTSFCSVSENLRGKLPANFRQNFIGNCSSVQNSELPVIDLMSGHGLENCLKQLQSSTNTIKQRKRRDELKSEIKDDFVIRILHLDDIGDNMQKTMNDLSLKLESLEMLHFQRSEITIFVLRSKNNPENGYDLKFNGPVHLLKALNSDPLIIEYLMESS